MCLCWLLTAGYVYIEAGSGRQNFLSYVLSLMRSYNDEHAGSIPSLDVMALKHVAYVFDAMIYYMKSVDDNDDDIVINTERIPIQSWTDQEDEDSKVICLALGILAVNHLLSSVRSGPELAQFLAQCDGMVWHVK